MFVSKCLSFQLRTATYAIPIVGYEPDKQHKVEVSQSTQRLLNADFEENKILHGALDANILSLLRARTYSDYQMMSTFLL